MIPSARVRLRARSKKRQREMIQRRKLVARLLAERPICQRCNAAHSSEIHEVLSRARGGSMLDEANCAALCHDCHSWVTTHPAKATAEGWLRSGFGGAS